MIEDMSEIDTVRCSRCRRDVDVRTTVFVRHTFVCDECMEPQREATMPVPPELDHDDTAEPIVRALVRSTQPEPGLEAG
jgi:recombinational DNA repair protein (RecF pathway)